MATDAQHVQQGGAKLFIGRLPFTADEIQVRELTESFGDIQDVAIVKNRETGQSKGCAFVKFATVPQAELCRNSLHDKSPFDGNSALQIRFAHGEAERLGIPEHVLNSNTANGETKLFIGGLPRTWEEDNIKQLFGQYGDLTFIRMFRNDDDSFKGAGFISYARRDQAFQAIEALHEKHTVPSMERPIQVKFAEQGAGKSRGKGAGKGEKGGVSMMGQGHSAYTAAGYSNQQNQQMYGGYQSQMPAQPMQASHGPPPPPTNNRTLGEWTEYFTPEGRPYYHNSRSNQTQWDKPATFNGNNASGHAAGGMNQAQRFRPY